MSKKIFLSPSNQSDNTYAYGKTNEAAECGEIAKVTENALKRCGFEVKTMQWETAQDRCKAANAWGADLYIPIHTNAFDGTVSGTRIFVYEKKGEAYDAAKDIYDELAPITPGKSENIQAYPQLIELKQPKAPAVYIEVDFHDVKDVAKWLIENTEAIGEAICKGVCKHFGVAYIVPGDDQDIHYLVKVGDYTTQEQANAMVAFLKTVGVSGIVAEVNAKDDTSEAITYKVNADVGLRLRTGPGTEYEIITLLPFGTIVKCIGDCTDVWLHVETADNLVGFCHSDFLTKL